jgi:uncharacterized membrane protein
MHRSLRLTIVLSLAACYVVGRLLMLAYPGISFSYLVLFVAAFGFGPRMGATVGLVGRMTSDLIISGLHQVFIPMALVDLTIGFGLGLVGLGVDAGQRGSRQRLRVFAILLFSALVVTVAYSVLADTYTWLYFNFLVAEAPDATQNAVWATVVLMGLVFNVPAVLFNMVLIPSTLPAILRNLYEAGLLPEPAAASDAAAATPSPSTPR